MITPNSKPSNLGRKKKNDAESAKQTQESRQSADNKKNRYQHLTITKKRITSQQAAIAQKKISLYSN
ncbi:hypothetical protein LNP05_07305 [Klebsiella pneumoniae subsp. pneumoniae]|nr:hypothetical protein [Klebsiella pneumoniae subsp. pneumoniae]